MTRSLPVRPVLALLLAMLAVRSAEAHFPWLTTDESGRALLFFGETPQDRAYKLPAAVAEAIVYSRDAAGKQTQLKLQAIEEDELIGRRSGEPLPAGAALEATCHYGLYHSMLLTYYAAHLPGGPAEWRALGDQLEAPLKLIPAPGETGLTITALWEGEPRQGVAVAATDAAGEQHEGVTDEAGVATLKEVAAGAVGVTGNFIEDSKGELDGKAYQSIGHYATLMFTYPGASAAGGDASPKYPPLPEPVSSFGGAVADGYLYVYSGHTGEEHEHSRDNLAQRFVRLKLNGGSAWEELPMETPLQGLPLVAHGGKIYRIGGLSARNAPGEKDDIHSVAEFASYDPASGQWTRLPDLPEPRSSHDAVVMGDKAYVVGGWTLTGSDKGKWLETAWSFDLTAPSGQWEPLPSPPFRRRALALGHWNGKLVALGGITDKKRISRSVDVLDLSTGQWSTAAELPGKRLDGFGASAWNQGERLFVSGTQDDLLVLAADGSQWKPAAKLRQPRFFHRLLPGENGRLLAVGGATEEGHVADLEELAPELQRRPAQ